METTGYRASPPPYALEAEMTSQERILVTGGTGLVGTPFVAKALKKGFDVFVGCHIAQPRLGKTLTLDLEDSESIKTAFAKVKPDAVVHLAAFTDVDGCERQKDRALKLNSEVTGVIAELARRHGSFLLYVSTDYVFDGEKGGYTEDDHPNPINWYGVSKLRGEEMVKGNAGSWTIARTSTPFGLHETRKSFPVLVAENLRKREEVYALTDQYTSPTYTENLADVLVEVLQKRIRGTIHLSGSTRASRLQVATTIALRLGLDVQLIRPTKMNMFSWAAKRPKDSSLDVSKASTTLENRPMTMEDGISRLVVAMGSSEKA